MDPFLLGETLASDRDPMAYFGPWMPAGGNDGVAAIEVFYVSGANLWTVKMETKKSDEDDSAVTGNIGSLTLSTGAAGVFKFDLANAEDLVRYRIDSLDVASIHFQFCQPLWAPN